MRSVRNQASIQWSALGPSILVMAVVACGHTVTVTGGQGGEGGSIGVGGTAGSTMGGQTSGGGAVGGGVPSGGGPNGGSGGNGGVPGLDECYVGNDDCADACHLVDCCAPDRDLEAECLERCEASIYMPNHGLRCLALRVFWIDEEGCETIVATYDAFEPTDDCND